VVPVRIISSSFPAVSILIPPEHNSRDSHTTSVSLIDTSDRKGLPAHQRYKNACIAAEDAAEEEARRRFKHYQDMYYVERALKRSRPMHIRSSKGF